MYLDVCEGINDYAYVVTLEKAVAKHKAAGTRTGTVAEAEKFLAALKRVIPPLPKVKGLATAEDGALVGKGIRDEARKMSARWRERIAGLLKALASSRGPNGADRVWPR